MKKEENNFQKNKSADTPLINIPSKKQPHQFSTYQSQASKKNQDYQEVF